MEMSQQVKCASCDEMVDQDDCFFIEDVGEVCCDCYDSDRSYGATVRIYNSDNDFYDGFEESDGAMVCTVGTYINETDGEFEHNYVHTDGWRGYVELKSDVWETVHEDVILAMSRDAVSLEEFYDHFKQIMDSKGLPYAVAFCPTSNVFSVNTDFYTKADYTSEVEDIVEKLKEMYRDPTRFVTTALTGADPEDQTPEDQLFALFASTLL